MLPLEERVRNANDLSGVEPWMNPSVSRVSPRYEPAALARSHASSLVMCRIIGVGTAFRASFPSSQISTVRTGDGGEKKPTMAGRNPGPR